MTSSDEDVNILASCFCLIIFISSGSGYSGFTSIKIDRSINRSVVIKAPYALTTKSDLEFFSPVTSSAEDITIFRGYYCKYQLAERPVQQDIICETSGKRASQTSKKNTTAQSTLGDTGSLRTTPILHSLLSPPYSSSSSSSSSS